MSYPMYDEYKSTGNEWLGDVPSHWEIKPIKYLSRINSDVLNENTDDDFEFEYIDIGSVSSGGKIQKTERMRFSSAPSRARRLVKSGDVIISTVRTYLRAIAPITEHAEKYVVSTGFCVVTPIGEINPKYCSYMLQSPYFVETVVAGSVGVSYPATNASDIANIDVCLPTYEEQTQIATFLDRETQKIDRLIKKQQQLIKLLQEKRQAVISHAVTKGLNPNAKMKDSGVEWLGEIPEHWELKRLKYLGVAVIGLTYSPDDVVEEGQGILVLRSSNIQNKKITYSNNVYVNKNIPDKLKTIAGDILICSRNGSRDLIGKNAIIDKGAEGLTFGAFMTIFRSKYNEYLSCVFNSTLFEFQSSSFLTSTINQLTVGNLNSFEIPLPPEKERVQIVEYIRLKAGSIDRLIEKTKQAIQLSKERRTALISAAVTGKIDVRNIADNRASNRSKMELDQVAG